MGSTPSEGAPGSSKFMAKSSTSEDLLKTQTVGLVHLSDFRKRRADALELKESEVLEVSRTGSKSSAATPDAGSPVPEQLKKRKKAKSKGKLSFAVDEDEGATSDVLCEAGENADGAPRSSAKSIVPLPDSQRAGLQKGRLGPNSTVSKVPKALTRSALSKAAHLKEGLRKDFLIMQESIRNSEIVIPFVFYDGTNVPGGSCRMKKGDAIWLFLDRARKVGAELGVGGADTARREWARVSVDDLMLVKHEIIIPHHYDFYYFIINATKGFHGALFDYAQRPIDSATSKVGANDAQGIANSITANGSKAPNINARGVITEGANHNPSFTKVVDRRWYERNKHIYPASIWEEFDPTKNYESGLRKDTQGNAFFLR